MMTTHQDPTNLYIWDPQQVIADIVSDNNICYRYMQTPLSSVKVSMQVWPRLEVAKTCLVHSCGNITVPGCGELSNLSNLDLEWNDVITREMT